MPMYHIFLTCVIRLAMKKKIYERIRYGMHSPPIFPLLLSLFLVGGNIISTGKVVYLSKVMKRELPILTKISRDIFDLCEPAIEPVDPSRAEIFWCGVAASSRYLLAD